MSLTQRIVSAMLMGLFVGALLNILTSGAMLPVAIKSWLELYLVNGLFDSVGQIFVRSLKLLVVPLVFVSLICGVSSLGNNARMGAVASKTVALYMATTAIAIALAIMVAVIVQPGAGIDLALATEFVAKEAPPLKDSFVCNIGDLLECWTNGQLVSTKHRVVNRTSNARFSIPIFCDPASEAVIDPRDFDELASYEAFSPCEAGQYIQSKNTRNFSHYKK